VGVPQRLIIGMAGISPAMTSERCHEFCPCYRIWSRGPGVTPTAIRFPACGKHFSHQCRGDREKASPLIRGREIPLAHCRRILSRPRRAGAGLGRRSVSACQGFQPCLTLTDGPAASCGASGWAAWTWPGSHPSPGPLLGPLPRKGRGRVRPRLGSPTHESNAGHIGAFPAFASRDVQIEPLSCYSALRISRSPSAAPSTQKRTARAVGQSGPRDPRHAVTLLMSVGLPAAMPLTLSRNL